MHEEFAGECEDDNVKTYEGEVAGAFAVVSTGFRVIAGVVGDVRVVGWQGVGEEYGPVERVGRARIESVGGEDDDDKDQRVEPGVSKGEGFPSSEQTLCFSPLGKGPEGFLCLGIPLGRSGLVSLTRDVSQYGQGNYLLVLGVEN